MGRKPREWAEILPGKWRSVRFVDSHLHLDGSEAIDAINLASAIGTTLVTCGTDKKTSLAGVKLKTDHPVEVSAFVGVHPSEALKESSMAWLDKALDRAVGVGEIGLDPKYSAIGVRSAQMRLFKKQLEVAQAASKPVQVHSRGAEAECLEVLAGYDLKSVLMHWFEGEDWINEVLRRGYYVSVGPALIYSRKLQRVARSMNRDRVLVETDFPVAYSPLGGVRGPSLIGSVVFKLAELWGIAFEDARASILENSCKFLSLPEKG